MDVRLKRAEEGGSFGIQIAESAHEIWLQLSPKYAKIQFPSMFMHGEGRVVSSTFDLDISAWGRNDLLMLMITASLTCSILSNFEFNLSIKIKYNYILL
jgi:hypothetical protein